MGRQTINKYKNNLLQLEVNAMMAITQSDVIELKMGFLNKFNKEMTLN